MSDYQRGLTSTRAPVQPPAPWDATIRRAERRVTAALVLAILTTGYGLADVALQFAPFWTAVTVGIAGAAVVVVAVAAAIRVRLRQAS